MSRTISNAFASGVFAALWLAASSPASTQPTLKPDCADPFTQAVMNMCAQADRHAAETEMEAIYQQVLAQFRQQDSDNADLGPEYVGAEMLLGESQQTWRVSRDDFCAARAVSFFGGSMRPAVVHACLAMMTRSRTQELAWLLD